MGEKCLPDELRTLFLFEALTDEQLQTLCENGHIADLRARPDCRRGRPGHLLLRPARRRAGDVQALGRRGHRDQPHLAARRVLRRMVGVHTRREACLRSIGAGDQAVTVLRAGRGRVRPLHAVGVSDGRASARGTYGRRPAAAADPRPAGEAAGARHHHGRPDPSAQQPGRGHRPRGRRPAREASARCGTSWRCWPTASSPRRRCASLVSIQDEVAEQVAKSKAQELTALEASDREEQIGDWLEDHGITGAWDYRTDVRRRRPGHRLAGTSLGIGRRGRRVGVAAGRHRLAEVHHRHRAADEPDRRGQQADLGAARRGKAVLADGSGAVPDAPTSTNCCTAR